MSPFALYTRVTDATWPQLEPYAQNGDLFWGKVAIPASHRALAFSSHAGLLQRMARENIADYTAFSLDGEYKDYALALADAKNIRAVVDDYNTGGVPLKFVAFYHLNIIDTYPQIVGYPDVVIVGKTSWSASSIRSKSKKYIDLIRAAGRTPSILLGDLKAAGRTKTYNTPAEVLANIQEALSIGVSTISYFYHEDECDRLLAALKVLRA